MEPTLLFVTIFSILFEFHFFVYVRFCSVLKKKKFVADFLFMFFERTERMLLFVSNLKKKIVAVFFFFFCFLNEQNDHIFVAAFFVFVSVFSTAVFFFFFVSVRIQNLKTNLDSNIFSPVLQLVEFFFLTKFDSNIYFLYCSFALKYLLQFCSFKTNLFVSVLQYIYCSFSFMLYSNF